MANVSFAGLGSCAFYDLSGVEYWVTFSRLWLPPVNVVPSLSVAVDRVSNLSLSFAFTILGITLDGATVVRSIEIVFGTPLPRS